MSGTSVEGSFKDCGPGKLPQLDFGCSGPNCNAVLQLPGGAAVDNGNGLEYSSKARCESDATDYLSEFVFTQPLPQVDSHVTQDQNITLPNCKGLRVQSDGSSAGTHVDSTQRATGPDCENPPPPSAPSVIPVSQQPPASSGSPLPQPPPTSSANPLLQPPPASSTGIAPPQQSSELGGVASSENPLPGPTSIQVVNGPSSTNVAGTPVNPASNPTSSQPAQFTGISSHHYQPKTGILLLLLFFLGLFIQGSSALLISDKDRRAEYELRIRQLSDNLHSFGTQLGGYIATRVNDANGNGREFAADLISDTVSSICQNFYTSGATPAFSPVVVENCVKAVYDDSVDIDPELEVLVVFSTSMFCNYLTSQAYPIANEFSSDACQGLQDLAVRPSAVPSLVPSQEPSVAPLVTPLSAPAPPGPPPSAPAPPPSAPAPPPSASVPPPSAPAPPPSASVPSPSAPAPPPSAPAPPPSAPAPSLSAPAPPPSAPAPSLSASVPPSPPPSNPPPSNPPPSNSPTTTPTFTNTSTISTPTPSPTSTPACSSATEAQCRGSCVDLTTDPNNCGACGVVCASGKCANGACSSNSCTGQTCDTFTTCGPGGSCVCASIVDNTGFCVSGETACSGLTTCSTSADCPLGAVCAVGTCCSTNVCIVADTCGGFSNSTTEASLLVRGWAGDTIAHRANWG